MKRALLLDTETTGLPADNGRCIEVAVCLFDLELGCPLASYSSLIQHTENPAEHVNHISPAAVQVAPPAAKVWPVVMAMAKGVDVIAAHRAEFDRQFVPEELSKRTWVCTKVDFDWPHGVRGDHLVHLALAYGVGVVSAHRAMTDVDIMARVLTRINEMGHKLPPMFERAARPKKKYVAVVPYERKDEAKAAGFLWDGDKREWYRHMPPEDIDALPFKVWSPDDYEHVQRDGAGPGKKKKA